MISNILRRHVAQPSVLRSALIRCYASFPPHSVIKMPALSPTMTAGGIGAWAKKAGDSIQPGDVLVEIETDKAQMDFEFQEEGVIAKILVDTGAKDISVGKPIAVLVEDAGDVAAFDSFTIADAGDGAAPAAPSTEPASAPAATPTSSAAIPETPSTPGRLQTALEREANINFAAKRLAIESGVDVSKVKGSGAGGRITVEDIKNAKASPSAASTAASYVDTPLTSMRKAIASRLLESTNTNPAFYVTSSISVSKLQKLRAALNASAEGQYKLSVNDFLVKAIGVACKKVPAANSAWMGDSIREFSNVDVSVAVSTPTGLITPIVTGVEARGLESISSTVKSLAKRAREGKLKPEEYQGGTICISNLGMNTAIDQFTSIINPPQAAILAVGTTKKVAIPVENEDGTTGVEWDDQIKVTATFDHKVVDGAVGAEWIKALKKVVENPLELLL
ncbi:Dihydrolipoyllysine-residue acetyltransferase [Ceratocystis lukuohia]|uniref:Acetyltransferase component of pyruvate dehydrogenase complex n=2 Tax=Ceratocystis TaxID=5157 RepID=A0A0F8DLC5_CERFI|nr:Dihydrolipoyllysine-residue acetyltransferase [Ceratocystis platani]